MERTLKTTRLSHVIGYLKWTNQEQKGNNQIALIKEEIKCRKRKGKQQRTDCTEWNRKHKQETQEWKKTEDGKKGLLHEFGLLVLECWLPFHLDLHHKYIESYRSCFMQVNTANQSSLAGKRDFV